jgi:hypothetical protein
MRSPSAAAPLLGLTVTLLAVALAACASGSTSSWASTAGGSDTACHEPGSRTLLQTEQVRVFRVDSGQGPFTWSCNESTGNRMTLDGASSAVFKRPALAADGHTLGYAEESVDDDGAAATRVRVIDTRKPGITAMQEGRLATPDEAKVGSLVVTAAGDIAWITCKARYAGSATFGPDCLRRGALDRVYLWPVGQARPRIVERGRTIEPQSLRRRGQRVFWTASGKRRTALLEVPPRSP